MFISNENVHVSIARNWGVNIQMQIEHHASHVIHVVCNILNICIAYDNKIVRKMLSIHSLRRNAWIKINPICLQMFRDVCIHINCKWFFFRSFFWIHKYIEYEYQIISNKSITANGKHHVPIFYFIHFTHD